MKNRISMLFFVFGLICACENSSNQALVPLSSTSLVGKWQLSETYISPGGPTEWQGVENGNIYEFSSKGEYALLNTAEEAYVQFGIYRLKDSILELEYTSDQATKIVGFNLQMTKTTFTLSPSYPTICFEACLSRFKRIN